MDMNQNNLRFDLSGERQRDGMTVQNGEHSMTDNTMGNDTGKVDVRSFQEMLLASVGRFVVCRFLIGTGSLMSATGILRNVGNDYFILEDPCTGMMTTCDLYAVKFVSVLPEDFKASIPSYCRRRLYENAPIFTNV